MSRLDQGFFEVNLDGDFVSLIHTFNLLSYSEVTVDGSVDSHAESLAIFNRVVTCITVMATNRCEHVFEFANEISLRIVLRVVDIELNLASRRVKFAIEREFTVVYCPRCAKSVFILVDNQIDIVMVFSFIFVLYLNQPWIVVFNVECDFERNLLVALVNTLTYELLFFRNKREIGQVLLVLPIDLPLAHDRQWLALNKEEGKSTYSTVEQSHASKHVVHVRFNDLCRFSDLQVFILSKSQLVVVQKWSFGRFPFPHRRLLLTIFIIAGHLHWHRHVLNFKN